MIPLRSNFMDGTSISATVKKHCKVLVNANLQRVPVLCVRHLSLLLVCQKESLKSVHIFSKAGGKQILVFRHQRHGFFSGFDRVHYASSFSIRSSTVQ